MSSWPSVLVASAPCSAGKRVGFTLIELLVVIAIIGTLVGLLLPAVQSARESGRKSQCGNNVKQQVLGAANYLAANGRWPTGGRSKLFGTIATGTDGNPLAEGSYAHNVESFFVQVLPFIEQAALSAKWNPKQCYWDTTVGSDGVSSNQLLAATKIPTYLCPSNTLGKDSFGGQNPAAQAAKAAFRFYGSTDFMSVSFTELDPTNGSAWAASGAAKNGYRDGLLTFDQSVKTALDGLSNTVIIFEDSGRPSLQPHHSTSMDTFVVGTDGSLKNVTNPQDVIVETSISGLALSIFDVGNATAQSRVSNRWADANGTGVQGCKRDSYATSGRQVINNSSQVKPGANSTFGGMRNDDPDYPGSVRGSSGACSWHVTDCGPNNEPFSLHAGNGCFAGFADGAVRFLSAKTDVQVIRQLCDPADGEQPLPW